MKKLVNGMEVEMSFDEIAEFNAREIEHDNLIKSVVYKKKQFDIKNADILKQLNELDLRTIRPLREKDDAKLTLLAAEAAVLRAQLLPTE